MSDATISERLRNKAIPLRHLEPGTGFSDLLQLKSVFADATIIGMGEATHGTREFVQVRHRLLEFLATEMGFNALVLESSYTDIRAASEYVLGVGDRANMISEFAATMWNTYEFAVVLDWLKGYNKTVSESKKVRLYGMDTSPNRYGRKTVLRFVRRVSPERSVAVEALFGSLADQERRKGTIDPKNEKTIAVLFPQLCELAASFEEQREIFIDMTSGEEYEEAKTHLLQMKYWLMANISELVPPSLPKELVPKNLVRSGYMAENVRYLQQRSNGNAKFVIWAHNYHLEVGLETPTLAEVPNMGSKLREWYGTHYYALGLEFNKGGYLSREGLPDRSLGHFKVGLFESTPQNSLPAVLSGINLRSFVLDLRTAVSDPAIARWSSSKHLVHTVSWLYKDPSRSYTEITLNRRRDGVLFIDDVEATRPTESALRAVAERTEV